MLKEREAVLRKVLMICDAAIVCVCFWGAYLIRSETEGLYPFHFYLGFLPVLVLIWSVILYFLGMYRSLRTYLLTEILFIVFKAGLLGFVIFGSLTYILKWQLISRTFIGMFFFLSVLLIGLAKMLMLGFFHLVRLRGYNYRNILLAGTGNRAQQFMKVVENHREWGLHIIGLIDRDPALIGKFVRGYKVIGTFDDLKRIIHNYVIDEVIFVVPGAWLRKIENYISVCETEGLKVSVAVDFFEPKISKIKLTDLSHFPLLYIESTPDQVWHLLIKRIFDVIVSFICLVILAPVFITISLFIKFTSPGPIFFAQERCGLNSRKFTLFKFRTMVPDAHRQLAELLGQNEMQGPAFKMTNDPRLTEIGKFLRKTSLDELPQLWNVLKGDMSLIGPRPPLPEEVQQYDGWHRRRLRMRPGITCLWQVNGRNNISNFDEWARLDLEYIEKWSLWLDCKILLKTIPVVLVGLGAK